MAMPSSSDHHSECYNSQPRVFLTPPPSWRKSRCSPAVKMPWSEKKPRRKPADLFHVIHKVPSGDSPYVRAKHVQLIEKDPSKAISLFWAAINSGDRVDSALKDMAVVMKQLDRSDEAIEAIKSFRHLCPPESQESLDNILVELYKQSGRIEEEIEMLQIKLKQLEEGIAFGGKRMKMARSQGKKIHITVEKEYSRLLGNLAWAYMQQKDYKSAEEHYRKALSFEPDKNKQCNLAACLMHMNKLTEAKFLLQAIQFSSKGHIDESHIKSYERASQLLVELESKRAFRPITQRENNNESGIAKDSADEHINKMVPSCQQMSKGAAATDFPYEKRGDVDWRRNRGEAYPVGNMAYESPFWSRSIPRVPLTQPRRYLRCFNGDQTKDGWLTCNAYGGSCRKLSFEPSSSDTAGSWRKNSSDNSLDKVKSQPVGPLRNDEEKMNSFGQLRNDEEKMNSFAYDCQKPATENCDLPTDVDSCQHSGFASTAVSLGPSDAKDVENHKKCWADTVEEEDEQQELESWITDFPPHGYSQESLYGYQAQDEFSVGSMNKEGYNDENVDSNIVSETPKCTYLAETLGGKIESIDLDDGYLTQPGKTTLSKHQSVRRSLCFGQHQKTVLNFEGQCLAVPEDFSPVKSMVRRNRLQVFQDITRAPGSPKP